MSWYQNVPCTKMFLVPKCPRYQNVSGTEMSWYRNVSGTEMSRYRNVHGTEMSRYRNVSGAEMSQGRNVPGTEMSLYRNVSGTEMSVPKCLLPKSPGPKCETAFSLTVSMIFCSISEKNLSRKYRIQKMSSLKSKLPYCYEVLRRIYMMFWVSTSVQD